MKRKGIYRVRSRCWKIARKNFKMTKPIERDDKRRAAALAKVERRIKREIAAIEAAGLTVHNTIEEIVSAGVKLEMDDGKTL